MTDLKNAACFPNPRCNDIAERLDSTPSPL